MANYMEQSLKLFMTQQQNIRGQVKRVVGVDPVGAVADIAQKNFLRWKSLQDEVLQRLMRGARETEEDGRKPEDRKKAG
jgi:polyhydroxyalkanoate synthesis regulator protein